MTTTREPLLRPARPLPGQPERKDWILDTLIEAARRLGCPVADLPRGAVLGARVAGDIHWVRDVDLSPWLERRYQAAVRAGERPFDPIRGAVPLPVEPVPQGYAVRSVSTSVDASGQTRSQSIRSTRETAPGEVTEQIPAGHSVRGVSTLVSGDGQTLAQWVKTGRDSETREQALERILRDLPTQVPAREGPIAAPPGALRDDLLAVYPMGDPHIGMLSWAPETGDSFDLRTAQTIMVSAMRELVSRGPQAERALIANLGDFFHSDDASNRTARSGHALDVDGRFAKVLRVGVDIMIAMIDLALTAHRRVRVINEIGNHDDHSAIFLSVALAAHYSAEPRVEIDMSPSRFHWHRHGKCLIGVTHGHEQKHSDLEAIMSAERAQDWGETVHRFWYVGHIHHSQRKEQRGCVIESFRTLAARDAWAAGVGYRAGRDMHRIVLHREHGEVGRDIVSASYLQSLYVTHVG